MVIAGALFEESDKPRLKKLGVKDSKLLSIRKMQELFQKIIRISKGHKIIIIPPAEIDEFVLSDHLNLNWLEAHKSAEIINELKPERAIIDSPSNNVVNYKRYLMKLLKNKKIELWVEHKADFNHVECSAASVLAKVTREKEVEKIKKLVKHDFGSGYTHDERTIKFLENNIEKYPEIFRKSWATYKSRAAMKNQKGLEEFGR